ncbi:MAG: GIY-YIG nuclease family protein [Sphingobacteriales bacterium]|nr:GIY-YIG nuclease family protein [Sphingobacteriales bacterium]
MNSGTYYVYILTNPQRSIIYTGVTNNLSLRILQHWENRGNSNCFTGRYYCYNLIYYEEFNYINNAIAREKEIKGWRRQKKEELIKRKNPEWKFLNSTFCDNWPPPKK